MVRQRLHKLMAACGVASRRACEELIRQGRVEVDGKVVTELGTQVDPETQQVRCDGQRLQLEPQLHFLLNKPRGAICSTTSVAGKPRAMDYLPPRGRDRRLYTIGRLDVDSEGAIILTNDGELCHLVSHPRFGIHKTYRVEVEGSPDEASLERMRKGVWLSEGRTGAIDIDVLRRLRDRTQLLVTLHEGRKREIRRVFARFGHEVTRLTRVAIGPIELGELRPGETRVLSPAEVAALRDSAQAVIRLGGGGPPRSARRDQHGRQSRQGRAGRPARAGARDRRRPQRRSREAD